MIDGRLGIVTIFHSPIPTSASQAPRVMIAFDHSFADLGSHDRYVGAYGSVSLPSVFGNLSFPDDVTTPMSEEVIQSSIRNIEPFSDEDTVACREEGCNNPVTSIDLSDGGQENLDKVLLLGERHTLLKNLLCVLNMFT